MTVSDLVQSSTKWLRLSKISSARLDSELIVSFVLNQDRTFLLANPDFQPKPQQLKKINFLVKLRAKHMPIAYIVGKKQFYGIDFLVNKNVLIPRIETEEIVDLANKFSDKDASVLEIGTGSGAIAISLKKLRSDLKIFASDKYRGTLEIAKKNSKTILKDQEIVFINSDLFRKINSKFDVVIANLPYVPLNIKTKLTQDINYEPEAAIFSGNDGLDLYRNFFSKISDYLNKDAKVIIESDHFQQKALIALAKKAKLALVEKTYWHLVFVN